MATPPKEIPHGTFNGYTHYRCRCELCRAAGSVKYHERTRGLKRRPSFKDDGIIDYAAVEWAIAGTCKGERLTRREFTLAVKLSWEKRGETVSQIAEKLAVSVDKVRLAKKDLSREKVIFTHDDLEISI